MKTELYRAIKEIDTEKLDDNDLAELLNLFMVTNNDLIRNRIAMIFADLHYDKSIPFILEKINSEKLFHNNGTLVYALSDFELNEYFLDIIRIICVHEYEPRLMAFEIVSKLVSSVPKDMKSKALRILEERRLILEQINPTQGENSALHFVEKTEELLKSTL